MSSSKQNANAGGSKRSLPASERRSKRQRTLAEEKNTIKEDINSLGGMPMTTSFDFELPGALPLPVYPQQDYESRPQQQQQQQQQQEELDLHFPPEDTPSPAGPQAMAPELRVGGFTLQDANITLPHALSPSERRRREADLAAELTFQEQHPPVLPPSQVPDLPPKPLLGGFHKFPDGHLSDHDRRAIEEANNAIAAEHQRIDRERNNMAAKKSRQSRLEALGNTRALLNDKAAECAWFRMKTVALGGSTAEWDGVTPRVKAGIASEIAMRVSAVDAEATESRKRAEAQRRADRSRISRAKHREGPVKDEESS